MRSSSDNLAYPGKEEAAPARHALRIRAPRATARSADPHSFRPRRLVELGVQAWTVAADVLLASLGFVVFIWGDLTTHRGVRVGGIVVVTLAFVAEQRPRVTHVLLARPLSAEAQPQPPHKSITGVIAWSRTNIGRKYGRARRAHFVAVPRNSSGASKFSICSRRPYLTRILWSPPVLTLYLATDHGAESNELPRVVIFMLVLSAASCSSHRPTGT